MGGIYHYLLYISIPQHLLFQIIMLFTLIIAVVIIFILIYLFQRARNKDRKDVLRKRISDMIIEIVICENEDEFNEVFLSPEFHQSLTQIQSSTFKKGIFIKELASICKKISGQAEKNIHWLFQKSDLEETLLSQLKNNRWHIKALAIQQMAYLDQNNHLTKIYRLTNHENILVRMEAQIAIVSLTGFKGLRFLNVTKHSITEWQQLRLLHELSRTKADNFNELSKWLKSKNESVMEFALRLAGIYQRYEQYENVVNCLSHSSSLICRLAIETLCKIQDEKTADSLITIFHVLDESLQLLILKMMKQVGTKMELPFLHSMLKHPDDAHKLEAARAIRNISESAFTNIQMHVDEYNHPWNIILPQIKMEASR